MAVDEAGGVPPTREWMQAAQRALETDGILDGSPSKRHKVCICICTLLSQHTSHLHTKRLLGESLSGRCSMYHGTTESLARVRIVGKNTYRWKEYTN